MDVSLRDGEGRLAAWRAGWRRHTRVARASVWLLGLVVASLIATAFDFATGLDEIVLLLATAILLPLLMVLAYRWSRERFLWKVRNRLILTYLLMGLAPVVLLVSLAGIAAFVLSGQYASDMGMSRLTEGLTRLRDQAGVAIVFGARGPTAPPDHGTTAKLAAGAKGHAAIDTAKGNGLPMDAAPTSPPERADATPISLMEWTGSTWQPLDGAGAKTRPGPLMLGPVPEWVSPGFEGIVAYKRLLYLCAEVAVPRNGRTVVVLASRPLTKDELTVMAKGLGRIVVSQVYSHSDLDKQDEGEASGSKPDEVPGKTGSKGGHTNIHVVGLTALAKGGQDFDGIVSAPLTGKETGYLDPPVWFTASLQVKDWETGKSLPGIMVVISKPRLLYALLFGSAVRVGNVVWAVLIGVAAFFALLEALALAMATSLSWTITRSVADLYEGTRAIDAGDLEHRIPVRRKDQLSALAGSFNGMAASVRELLARQRENERLQHELEIAQEVQTTLFPKTPTFLGALEMHGACIAARTVGGDYFDFVFGEGVGAGTVLLALGDISGKGISAALLMSALQSAVRAFSAGMEEADDLPASPAMLLKLLNEHLFRSTQEARYATLFLGLYEAGTGRLTYSNAGHLPPLLLSADGTVRRLDVGGTVVGLMEFVAYDEATVQMEKGDLLVAFTDGLTEPQREEEDFGEERLLAFTRERLNAPLTELGRDLLHEVQVWIGEQEQPDDMTVVLARVR